MRPYLHKYIGSSPSTSSVSAKKSKRATPNRKVKKPVHSSSVTTSCDTVIDYGSEQKFSEPPSSAVTTPTSLTPKALSPVTKGTSAAPSESKVIFIDTTSSGIMTDEIYKSSKSKVKSSLEQSKYYKYWTVSITSTHSEAPKDVAMPMMAFGICDATPMDESKEEVLTTNIDDDNDVDDNIDMVPNHDVLSSNITSNEYEDGYYVTYGDHEKYQSYHTRLKSLDDLLIAHNLKSSRISLWQNGRRFNRIFQLKPDRYWGLGIKLMSDDYSINIMADTGN